ncbi:transmembrane protein 64-like [Penaeus japonicus]|uniref:transmembrane protein 64-like n=1 Tax=Penaeus japonicus TaxID=27405 RepID=UPI001C711CBD|nr:transmembrane protein 64-like [Penaeus japonicus]
MRFLPRWCIRTSSVTPSPNASRGASGEGERGGVDRGRLEDGGIFDNNADIESLGLGRIDKKRRPSKGARTHLTNALATVVVIVAVGGGWYLSRDYLRQVLLWVAVQEAWVVVGVFLALFTFVSFPFMWGYILVNISAGYMFGTWRGLAVVVSTATACGGRRPHAPAMLLEGVHHLSLASQFLQRRVMTSRVLRALLSVLGGSQAFKVIAITRLTPIPFGLQNAVFAVSRVSTWLYLFATVVGLLPTQILNCYLGTTVRSLDEVVSDSSSATATGWIVFAAQILISICLTLWVVRRAKAELHSTMALQLTDASSSTASSSSLPCTPKRPPDASSYRRASHADVATITTTGCYPESHHAYKGVAGRKSQSGGLFLELLPNNLRHMGLPYGIEEEKSKTQRKEPAKGEQNSSPNTCSTSSSFVQRSSSSASRRSSTDDDFILVTAPDHPA